MNTKKLTQLSLLTALALIIFIIEAQIPPILPIPGAKIGLANIITVYAMFRYRPGEVLLLVLSRIVLGAIFAGSGISLLYSLCGGLCCFAVMLLAKRFVSLKQIWVCSILGAIAHNLGQIAIAMVLTGTWRAVYYLPALLAVGIPAGLFTGVLAQYLLRRQTG